MIGVQHKVLRTCSLIIVGLMLYNLLTSYWFLGTITALANGLGWPADQVSAQVALPCRE
jgi:hypothetical protein